MQEDIHISGPLISEEQKRTHRVNVYLSDLKKRLKDLRQQHDEIIHHSVEIIQEINDVSSMLRMSQTNKNDSMARIKRLIREFESTNPLRNDEKTQQMTTDVGDVEIKQLIENFDKLNESHVLRESLLFFKRAKESFEKIDDYLSKIQLEVVEANTDTAQSANYQTGRGAANSLRDRINMFNNAAGSNLSSSCVSSSTSLEAYLSVPKVTEQMNLNSHSMWQSGYEGDVDSELEITEVDES